MTVNLPRRGNVRRPDFSPIHDDFKVGVMTLVEEARIPTNGAKEVNNLYQTQDGVYTTRPGSDYYGESLPNGKNPDGSAEYVKSDGTTELIAVGVKAYKSVDGGTWSEITGATFTEGESCYFVQLRSRLYITNGTDNLAFYNGTNLVSYSEISAPTWAATPLARTTLTSGAYSVYYIVTALNDVGETIGSTEQTITVNKTRDTWASGETITLDFNAVSGASRYQIYFSDESGYETLIGNTTNTEFIDDGTGAANTLVEVPLDNTTGAPKFRQMEISGNRIWATDDPNNKYRVYWSGTGQNTGKFSDFYGGGNIDLELGGREVPKSVVHYRTGKGDSIVTVICSSPDGQGSIWQISLDSLTVGDTAFTVPTASKIVGSIGTSAPLSVVKFKNDIGFYNKKGFTSLGSKANLLNILATDELSVNIRPSVRSLVASKANGVCGHYYDGKIYWSVPESSSGNDKIYIFDTERRNWQISWSLGVKQFIEYTQTDGNTKLLAIPLTGDKLIQISESISGDMGQPFTTKYTSGLYAINKDRTVAAKVKYAYIELGRPKGRITFTILGTEKNKPFSSIGSITITDQISQTGYTWDKYSTNPYSSSSGTPTSFSSSTIKKRIKISKKLYNYQAQVTSSGYGDFYQLLSWQLKGRIVPGRTPSSWNS